MKRLSLTLMGSLAVLLLASAGARATPSTIFLTENWAPGASQLYAQGFSSGNDHYISFSNESAVTLEVPVNGSFPPSSILATNLKTVSSAASASVADHVDSDYTLSVVLTNNATNDTASLTFKGHLDALFAKNYASTNMADTFYYDSHNNHVSTVTQSVVIDGYTISVTLGPFTPFSNPGSQNNGSIGGVVSASIGGNTGPGPGQPGTTPEPSTLVMSFLGLSGLGLASWRKWRAGKLAAA